MVFDDNVRDDDMFKYFPTGLNCLKRDLTKLISVYIM